MEVVGSCLVLVLLRSKLSNLETHTEVENVANIDRLLVLLVGCELDNPGKSKSLKDETFALASSVRFVSQESDLFRRDLRREG